MENTITSTKSEPLLKSTPPPVPVEEVRKLINQFIDAVCALSQANRLTGIWDNRRFQECKKPYEQVDTKFLYLTEKLSRKNVELRAVHRKAIDILFKQLLEAVRKPV